MEITPFWEEQRLQLAHYMRSETMDNFLRWTFLGKLMVHEPEPLVLDELQRSMYWKKIEPGLVEHSFGNPFLYHLYPISSGNLIHHAYSLLQLYNFIGYQKTDIKSVFEFGGGYGSFCRLMYNLGLNGKYTIYDLPELSEIQKIYLTNIKIDLKNITFATELNSVVDVDLFVSLWALEEAPESVRNNILNLVRPKKFLIAFNSRVDYNYFEQFTNNKEYTWLQYQIKHLPGNSYLIGEKTND